MTLINVAEAQKVFPDLIDRVEKQGETIELERNHRIVARIAPAMRKVAIRELDQILKTLPALAEDATAFAEDVERIRAEMPAEKDPWA